MAKSKIDKISKLFSKSCSISNESSTEKLKDSINELFKKYEHKFFKPPKENRLTEYEEAVGFTEKSRVGAKQFANQFGYFMEDVYSLSPLFQKTKKNENKGGNDGYNDGEYFECKNRYDTMKQSMAVREIKPKLEHAIKSNKSFKLLVLVDKKYKNQNIPLHQGSGLSGIKNIKGYNLEKHRWISGDEVYKHIFRDFKWLDVKNHILILLKKLR